VVHPADVFTVVVAWLAVLAVCVAAVLFGQTARRAPRRRRRRRSRAARMGLFLSLSGPWLVLLAGATAAALTGAWLPAAAVAACGIVLTALAGLTLRPR
jgi:sterol desaturase/sphingolipid hydroxylase (fatty acid hydroxylase superfamily)